MAKGAGLVTLVRVHQSPALAGPDQAAGIVALVRESLDGTLLFGDQLQGVDGIDVACSAEPSGHGAS